MAVTPRIYWSYIGSGGTPRYASFTQTDTIVGTKNKNWKSLVQRKSDATSPYSRTGLHLLRTPSYLITKASDGSIISGGTPTIYSSLASGSFNPDVGTELYQKYDEALTNINALTLLAEDAREFRALYEGIAGKTESYYKFANRKLDVIMNQLRGKHIGRDRRHVADIVNEFSDLWLTYSFGVKPLMSSASQVAQSLAATAFGERANETFGTTKEEVSSVYVPHFAQTDISATYSYRLWANKTTTTTKSVRYGFGMNPNISVNGAGPSSHFGLDSPINSIATTAWELVPYSWVVDYFSTAAGVVDGYSRPSVSANLIFGYKSVKVQVETEISYEFESLSSVPKAHLASSNGQIVRSFIFTRTPTKSFPTPELRLRSLEELATKNRSNQLLNLASVIGGKGKLLSRLLT